MIFEKMIKDKFSVIITLIRAFAFSGVGQSFLLLKGFLPPTIEKLQKGELIEFMKIKNFMKVLVSEDNISDDILKSMGEVIDGISVLFQSREKTLEKFNIKDENFVIHNLNSLKALPDNEQQKWLRSVKDLKVKRKNRLLDFISGGIKGLLIEKDSSN